MRVPTTSSFEHDLGCTPSTPFGILQANPRLTQFVHVAGITDGRRLRDVLHGPVPRDNGSIQLLAPASRMIREVVSPNRVASMDRLSSQVDEVAATPFGGSSVDDG